MSSRTPKTADSAGSVVPPSLPQAALGLPGVQRAARRAARRLGALEVLDRLVAWSPLPLLLTLVTLGCLKLGPAVPRVFFQLLVSLLALTLVALLLFAIRVWRSSVRDEAGALALDRHHRLDDRLTTALAFSRELKSQRDEPTPEDRALTQSLMELAIADALARAPRLEPRRAVPFQLPPRSGLSAALIAGLGVLGALEVQGEPVAPPEIPSLPADRVVLFDDDAELLRELGRELEQLSETPEAQAQVREFNRLVEELSTERLDRREAFVRLEALERAILGSGKELDELDEALREMAQELERASLSRPAGEALAEGRLADAEQAMQKLADRLRNQDAPPSRSELDALRNSLKRASEVSQARRAGAESESKALESERKRLLEKKQAGTLTPEERAQLDRTERQLERLGRRQQAAKKDPSPELSELDRELAEAARELHEARQGKASDFLDQGAETLNRMQQKQLSQKEKQQLLERMREMRDLLRQQKGGEQQESRAERMRRLGQRARGEDPNGDGQEGRPSRGTRPGSVQLGPGGQPIPMTGSPQQGQTGKQSDSTPGEQPGAGKEAGSGHDPSVRGETPSTPQGKTEDVMAVAADTGQGTASSEVIYSAAQRGFRSGEYRRIFTDYKTVAEEVIEREGVPPGYRSHVRRYFQLIRPRE